MTPIPGRFAAVLPGALRLLPLDEGSWTVHAAFLPRVAGNHPADGAGLPNSGSGQRLIGPHPVRIQRQERTA